MIGDACEDISKPCLRIDVAQLRGLDQGVDDGGALPATIGSAEQPCLAYPSGEGRLAWIGIERS